MGRLTRAVVRKKRKNCGAPVSGMPLRGVPWGKGRLHAAGGGDARTAPWSAARFPAMKLLRIVGGCRLARRCSGAVGRRRNRSLKRIRLFRRLAIISHMPCMGTRLASGMSVIRVSGQMLLTGIYAVERLGGQHILVQAGLFHLILLKVENNRLFPSDIGIKYYYKRNKCSISYQKINHSLYSYRIRNTI